MFKLNTMTTKHLIFIFSIIFGNQLFAEKLSKNDSCDSVKAIFTTNTNIIEIANPLVEFTNTSQNATNYTWDFGNNYGYYSNDLNETFKLEYEIGNNIDSYLISLIASNNFGCSDTTTMELRISDEIITYIPNTFTPDGNDYNQEFKPILYSNSEPYKYSMQIFNRRGHLLFKTNDYAIGWNGFYNNKISEDGAYIWKVSFQNPNTDAIKQLTGTLFLIK